MSVGIPAARLFAWYDEPALTVPLNPHSHFSFFFFCALSDTYWRWRLVVFLSPLPVPFFHRRPCAWPLFSSSRPPAAPSRSLGAGRIPPPSSTARGGPSASVRVATTSTTTPPTVVGGRAHCRLRRQAAAAWRWTRMWGGGGVREGGVSTGATLGGRPLGGVGGAGAGSKRGGWGARLMGGTCGQGAAGLSSRGPAGSRVRPVRPFPPSLPPRHRPAVAFPRWGFDGRP